MSKRSNTLYSTIFTLTLLCFCITSGDYALAEKQNIRPNGIAVDYNDINKMILAEDDFITSLYESSLAAGTQLFKANIGGWVDSSPAIDTDGTIYIGSNNTYFYAINSDGSIKWSYHAADIILSSPALDEANESVYFGCPEGKLYALKLDGSLLWQYQTNGPIYSSPNLDSNGNIYFGSNDHKLYVLDKNGNLIWSYEAGSWIDTKPAISSSGDVYFASYDGKIYSVNSTGTLNWTYTTDSWFSFSLTLGSDGVIYAGSYDNNLYAVNSSGSLLWTYTTHQNTNVKAYSGEIFSSPLVTQDAVYFGSNDYSLYKVDKSGNLKWSYVTGIAWYDGSAVGTTPALDADGNIIFGSRDKKLYAVDSNGTLQWSFDTGGSIYSSPRLDAFGNIYFGSADGNVYKLGDTAKLMKAYSIPLAVDDGIDIYDYENYLSNQPYSIVSEIAYDTSINTSKEAFTENAPEVLDEALKILHLTRSNLNQFEYASTENQARLSSVTLSLDDPVAGAEYSKSISDSIANAESLSDIVRYAASANDFTVNPMDFSKNLSGTPLETAVRDVFTSNNVSITPAQVTDLLNQLANVPLEIQKGTALILYALDESLVTLNEAFSSLTIADKSKIGNESFQMSVMGQGGNTLKSIIDILDKVNKQKLYGSCLKLLSAIEQAETHFSAASGISSSQYLFNFGTPIGKIVIGGTGANNYTDDSGNASNYERTVLLIDTGGNDVYKNRAGSSTPNNPISILLDLSGNDEYDCMTDFSQGSGRLGHGILIDYDGTDKYIGSDLTNPNSGYSYIQGAAFFGVGILDDRGADNDFYVGDYLSQGASTIGGLAILNDDGGNDNLYCREYSQAFGFIKGIGVLRDVAGNDFYASGGTEVDFRENAAGQERYVCMSQGFGFGARRDTYPSSERYSLSGGCGILIDIAGNDVYSGDYFAQGSSYWYALGILNDRSGNDLYYARRYSQGTGTHVSVGYLIDGAGDDFYQSWIVSQGHGLDSSVGVLIDISGNDIYSMKGWYGQGAGGGGLGILVDNGGNDIYYAYDTGGQGFGDPYMSNVFTPIGIVIDVGGFDLYSQCFNNQRRTKYTGGVTIDVSSGKSGFLSD